MVLKSGWLTHNEEEFENNKEVGARVGVGDNSGRSLPVVQEVVDGGQEETHVGYLEEEELVSNVEPIGIVGEWLWINKNLNIFCARIYKKIV